MKNFEVVLDKDFVFEQKQKLKKIRLEKAHHYKKMQKKMLDRAIEEHKKGNMILEKDYLALAEQYAKGYAYERICLRKK